jgi:hypothetical protein
MEGFMVNIYSFYLKKLDAKYHRVLKNPFFKDRRDELSK